MTEQKVKKRGWVKNAAIIFLSVMLVLTFFSNTIMNHSLPEVAATYVQSGALNERIRGTGTVTANESFEVKCAQTREVLSVPVKVGDEVKVGDTLLLYSDAESTQLQEAQTALDALILEYKKALLEAGGGYEKETRDIKLAQDALDKAKAKRSTLTAVSLAEIATAKANFNRAKAEYTTQQAVVSALETKLSGMNGGTDNSSQITAKNNEIIATQAEMDAAMLVHGTGYDNLTKCATAWRATYPASQQKDISVYKDALYQKYKELITVNPFPATEPAGIPTFPTVAPNNVTFDKATVTAMVNAYAAVNPSEVKLKALRAELADLYNSAGADANYYNVKSQLAAAKTTLATLENSKNSYETTLTELQTMQKEYEDADASVTACQKELENLMYALADKKIQAGKAGLDLADKKAKIAEKSAALEKLKKGGDGASVECKVNGVVSTVNVSAGKKAEADSVLMVIEVPDMGYGISFSVTTEQSRKVAVGDEAEVTNYYSSEPITATLVGIRPDTKNPSTNKLLYFKIQGEVESGAQLSLSVGQRGGNYEAIVPNSAIRSDNNGKFVLIIVAKSSPLGNRYIAQRIDVKVVASDDANSAVSGGLTTSDFVITTSTKPIEPGTQVRMPDSQ